MSFFTTVNQPSLGVFNTTPLYQPTNNNMVYFLFMIFIVMIGLLFGGYLYKISAEDAGKAWFLDPEALAKQQGEARK